jgi:hypothetical protein
MEKCLNPGHSTRLETGPGLQCEVWQPAVAAGCHNVVAHRAAWPGRLDDPQCARDGARWHTWPWLVDSSFGVGSRVRA